MSADTVKDIRSQLVKYRDPIAKLAPKNITADHFLTSAMMMISQSEDLQRCSVQSIGLSLMRISQWGLVPGVTAYLIPFKGKCTAVADYKGLIQLMIDCGARDVDAQVVRKGDVYERTMGLHADIKHLPGPNRTGELTHAYAVVRLPHNVHKMHDMTVEEIDVIRQQYSLNWKKGPVTPWYAKKTVVRQIAKFVPMYGEKGARLRAALDQDESNIPDAEITPITGDVQAIPTQLPRRDPTHGPLDLSEMQEEIGTVQGETPAIIKAFESEPDYAF